MACLAQKQADVTRIIGAFAREGTWVFPVVDLKR